MMATTMRTFILRDKHKKRLYLILVAAAVVVLWFYFKSTPEEYGEDMMEEGVEGLTFSKRQFFLGKKPFRILSGAMHYFRVPRPYWRDRMMKMKACGLNTLETYVSWNAHEPVPGKFTYEGMLNVREYIELASEMGLYVILRPGPYICSEWDFGGMPSWLLADRNMKVRSNYPGYQEAISRFFGDLLPRLADLQFTKGGPIIAVQVENEFGSYSQEVDHLLFIKGILRLHGITELLVTSDNSEGLRYAPFYNDALPTANFKDFDQGRSHFELIRQTNEDFPLMVMEFWSGWFDHWGQTHNADTLSEYVERVTAILEAGASINFYMFHGGTNFGFMAGANEFQHYKPDVTSYDYDAPLSEAGDITEKYMKTREIILEKVYKPLGIMKLPEIPPNTPKKAYDKLRMEEYMDWNSLTSLIMKKGSSVRVQPMEMYQFAHGVGQSYGYIIYRKTIGSGNTLELPGKVRDRVQVLLNTWLITTFDSDSKHLQVDMHASQPQSQLDLMVENLARVNFINHHAPDPDILNKQRKGLDGDVKIDGKFVTDWSALALDFDQDYIFRVSRASQWKSYVAQKNSPTLYRAYLNIEDTPQDTFINMKDWKKGIVMVNGVNLGRYWDVGPQRTLYLPAPFLKQGKNEILVFEEFSGGEYMFFETEPQLG
ncbi:beta-galactosidase-1-like protein 2 isoform X2 [Babylonia areolata]|uniref:beta-galactosidase-1-like protein 2 isoform X2 n=1 Tax=Babylonia areolata TaxID=304850 RepID=UPI003FD02232